jgi:hypothetical protein
LVVPEGWRSVWHRLPETIAKVGKGTTEAANGTERLCGRPRPRFIAGGGDATASASLSHKHLLRSSLPADESPNNASFHRLEGDATTTARLISIAACETKANRGWCAADFRPQAQRTRRDNPPATTTPCPINTPSGNWAASERRHNPSAAYGFAVFGAARDRPAVRTRARSSRDYSPFPINTPNDNWHQIRTAGTNPPIPTPANRQPPESGPTANGRRIGSAKSTTRPFASPGCRRCSRFCPRPSRR